MSQQHDQIADQQRLKRYLPKKFVKHVTDALVGQDLSTFFETQQEQLHHFHYIHGGDKQELEGMLADYREAAGNAHDGELTPAQAFALASKTGHIAVSKAAKTLELKLSETEMEVLFRTLGVDTVSFALWATLVRRTCWKKMHAIKNMNKLKKAIGASHAARAAAKNGEERKQSNADAMADEAAAIENENRTGGNKGKIAMFNRKAKKVAVEDNATRLKREAAERRAKREARKAKKAAANAALAEAEALAAQEAAEKQRKKDEQKRAKKEEKKRRAAFKKAQEARFNCATATATAVA